MRLRWILPCLAAFVGCTTEEDTTTHEVPTSVAVDPAEFLGSVPCTGDDGAARSYTALINDVTDGSVLAKSQPVSCTLPVSFINVKEGHTYSAEIAVYDLPPDQVQEGLSQPRWETTCASDGQGLATAVLNTREFIHGCVPIKGPGTGVTAIDIDIASLTNALGAELQKQDPQLTNPCDAIAALRVEAIDPPSGSLPDVVLLCGQDTVTYDTSLVAPAVYEFVVRAFEPQATTARWAARCTASTLEGVRVKASCTSLSEYGSIQIDAASLLTDASLVCDPTKPDAAAKYDVEFDEDATSPIILNGQPCDHDAVVGPAIAGDHSGAVTVRDLSGKILAHAICFVTVEPGATVVAPCVPG